MKEIKPWWIEMPQNPTKKQVVAEMVVIIASALLLTSAIFWVVL